MGLLRGEGQEFRHGTPRLSADRDIRHGPFFFCWGVGGGEQEVRHGSPSSGVGNRRSPPPRTSFVGWGAPGGRPCTASGSDISGARTSSVRRVAQ